MYTHNSLQKANKGKYTQVNFSQHFKNARKKRNLYAKNCIFILNLRNKLRQIRCFDDERILLSIILWVKCVNQTDDDEIDDCVDFSQCAAQLRIDRHLLCTTDDVDQRENCIYIYSDPLELSTSSSSSSYARVCLNLLHRAATAATTTPTYIYITRDWCECSTTYAIFGISHNIWILSAFIVHRGSARACKQRKRSIYFMTLYTYICITKWNTNVVKMDFSCGRDE